MGQILSQLFYLGILYEHDRIYFWWHLKSKERLEEALSYLNFGDPDLEICLHQFQIQFFICFCIQLKNKSQLKNCADS